MFDPQSLRKLPRKERRSLSKSLSRADRQRLRNPKLKQKRGIILKGKCGCTG